MALDLELDLDVFAGPFDLLLTLVLREEVDLLEVDLAQVVVAYVEHLERRGELELELATEFLVLIAALLELKSRLMLPGEEPELDLLEPAEAAEELLARLLDAHRFRGAAMRLRELLDREAPYRYRRVPPPAELLRGSIARAENVYAPRALPKALGRLLLVPRPLDLGHMATPRVSVSERLEHLRRLLGRGRFSFDVAVESADRVTVAVTVWALLELYRRGECSWTQDQPFGEITVHSGPGRLPVEPAARPAAAAVA